MSGNGLVTGMMSHIIPNLRQTIPITVFQALAGCFVAVAGTAAPGAFVLRIAPAATLATVAAASVFAFPGPRRKALPFSFLPFYLLEEKDVTKNCTNLPE